MANNGSRKPWGTGARLALGIAFGIGIGAALSDGASGIGFGIALGCAFGLILLNRKNNPSQE
jgi:hypothetical protein